MDTGANNACLASLINLLKMGKLQMSWWVYKCNSKNDSHQVCFGDWEPKFKTEKAFYFGTTELLPKLAQLAQGDKVLAYQTDLNELVGVTVVEKWKQRGQYQDLYLKVIERIGVKVRPLKDDPKVAAIHAFKTREIKTVYEISDSDAEYLLDVSRMAIA